MTARLQFDAVSGIHARFYSGIADRVRESPERLEEAIDLATLWQNLVAGVWYAGAGFCFGGECFLVVEPRRLAGRPLAPRAVEMLRQILTGESQKVLAIDGALSRSTVATRSASCLRAMGREHTLSRVPTLVLLAAHAASGALLVPARMRIVSGAGRERWLVRCDRPDGALRAALSDAESAVVGLLVEGRTHDQIARIRQTSRRTIANQLGSSFRKLGVSGRTALVAKSIQGLPPRPTSLVAKPIPRLHAVREHAALDISA